MGTALGRITDSWTGAGTAKYINYRRGLGVHFVGNPNGYVGTAASSTYTTGSATSTTYTTGSATTSNWQIDPSKGG